MIRARRSEIPRSAWRWAAGVVGLSCACCRGGADPSMPGASTAGGDDARTSGAAERPPEPWPELPTVRSWPTLTEEPVASEGHLGGRYDVSIHVSPESRQAYGSLVQDTTLPVGATIAKFHFERRSGDAGPIYAMTKRSPGWEFIVAGADGMVRERGDLPLCRRCHEEGVADSLFGPVGRFRREAAARDGGAADGSAPEPQPPE